MLRARCAVEERRNRRHCNATDRHGCMPRRVDEIDRIARRVLVEVQSSSEAARIGLKPLTEVGIVFARSEVVEQRVGS